MLLIWHHYNFHKSPRDEPAGCRRLGVSSCIPHSDQYNLYHSEILTQRQGKAGSIAGRVQSLFIYPVKGCKAVELDESRVLGAGMEYDRQFSLAQLSSDFPLSLNSSAAEISDIHKWVFITQRQYSHMANIKAEIWIPDPSSPDYSDTLPNVRSRGVLVLRFPSTKDNFWGKLVLFITARIGGSAETKIELPYDPTPEQIQEAGYPVEKFKIWNDTPKALNLGSTDRPGYSAALAELHSFIGLKNPLGILRVAHDHHREVFRCAPRKGELGYQSTVGFADAYPLHIMGLASVQDLARRLPSGTPKLSPLQFRSNIYVTGCEAYAEDSWKRIRIGGHEYHVVCRTVRCTVPNVNQDTGVKHEKEPRNTMLAFRKVDPGAKKLPCMGMQMVPVMRDGIVRVGDDIEVLETGEHYYIGQ
ncbi:MAG: hypothetical protein LQ351_003847 [Letrouitia transgressa]|nr:MAG: hypothetical protein LQ351_003847 [Letrouitia transgressa]